MLCGGVRFKSGTVRQVGLRQPRPGRPHCRKAFNVRRFGSSLSTRSVFAFGFAACTAGPWLCRLHCGPAALPLALRVRGFAACTAGPWLCRLHCGARGFAARTAGPAALPPVLREGSCLLGRRLHGPCGCTAVQSIQAIQSQYGQPVILGIQAPSIADSLPRNLINTDRLLFAFHLEFATGSGGYAVANGFDG